MPIAKQVRQPSMLSCAERVYDALVSYGVSPDQLAQKTSDAKLDRFGSYILDRAATISPAK